MVSTRRGPDLLSRPRHMISNRWRPRARAEPDLTTLCLMCAHNPSNRKQGERNFHDYLPSKRNYYQTLSRSECPLCLCPLLLCVCVCGLFIARLPPLIGPISHLYDLYANPRRCWGSSDLRKQFLNPFHGSRQRPLGRVTAEHVATWFTHSFPASRAFWSAR